MGAFFSEHTHRSDLINQKNVSNDAGLLIRSTFMNLESSVPHCKPTECSKSHAYKERAPPILRVPAEESRLLF